MLVLSIVQYVTISLTLVDTLNANMSARLRRLEKAVARIRYSPIERCTQHKIHPYAVIFHMINLFFATLLVCTHVHEVGRLKLRSSIVFSKILYPYRTKPGSKLDDKINALSDDIDLNPIEDRGLSSYYIISSEQLVRDVNQLVERFFSFEKKYVGCANKVCEMNMSGHAAITTYKNSTVFDVDSSVYTYSPLALSYQQVKLSSKDNGLPKDTVLGSHWNSKNKICFMDQPVLDYINRLVVLDVNFAIITDDITVPFGGEVMRNAYTLRVKYTASTTGQVLVTMESFLHEFPLEQCFLLKNSTSSTTSTTTTTTTRTLSSWWKQHVVTSKQLGLYLSVDVIVVLVCMVSSFLYQFFLLQNIFDSYQLWTSVKAVRVGKEQEGKRRNGQRQAGGGRLVLSSAQGRRGQGQGNSVDVVIARQEDTCYSKAAFILRIFNWSLLCGTAGNVCLFFYGVLHLVYKSSRETCSVSSSFQSVDKYNNTMMGDDDSKVLLALAIMLMWFDMLQYFAYGEEGSNLKTLQNSAFKVGRVVVLFLPIYTGYVVFGVSTFGAQVPQFQTFSSAAINLFAILNGDECRQTYVAVQKDCTNCSSPIVGWIYLSSWICFAMYVILNVVMATIEDVYIGMKEDVSVEKLGSRHTENDCALDGVIERVVEVLQRRNRARRGQLFSFGVLQQSPRIYSRR